MWRVIPNYPNYMINTEGKIKSKYSNLILKESNHTNGYKTVMLYENGKSKRLYIHRLMGITFLLDNFSKGKEINHKDGNKANNSLSNLEWVTKSQNHLHRVYNLNKGNMLPKKVQCVETGAIYESVKIATKDMKLKNPICISNAATGKRNKAAGFHWQFI